MIDFHKTCRGNSHIKAEKVCQDYSVSLSEPELSVAIVSDGHGGDRYFRSDIGSRLACVVSLEMIREFVHNCPDNPFENTPFTQVGVNWECQEGAPKEKVAILKQLTWAILYKWKQDVKHHAKANPLTDEEKEKVPVEYHSLINDESKLEKVYGCTLMAYVRTPQYWLAFQIGDGKCLSFHSETGPKQPILWDDACFLNKTTSLCDSNAVNEFRCTFEGDGIYPYAVVLGSDGLDDSFGEDKNLINFYIQLLKLAFQTNKEVVEETLSQDLPILSKRGSQDDMSVASIVDETVMDTAVKELIQWQLNNVMGELNHNKGRIHKFHKERKSLEDVKDSNTKAAIDYEYAIKEILIAIENRKRLIQRYNDLAKELDENNPILFNDDIPYEKVIPQSSTTKVPEKVSTEIKPAEMAKDTSGYIHSSKYRGFRDKKGNKLKRKLFRNKNKRKNRR